jgi:hypothetical protein
MDLVEERIRLCVLFSIKMIEVDLYVFILLLYRGTHLRRFGKRNEISQFIHSCVGQHWQDQGATSRSAPRQNKSPSIGITMGAMSKDTLRVRVDVQPMP